MADELDKSQDVDLADEANDTDSFVGVRNLGGGVFQDLRYTPAHLAAYIAANCQKKYTVTEAGDTISDPFFDNNIIALIITGGQVYLADVDFSQPEGGGDITGITIEFTEGQILLAKI